MKAHVRILLAAAVVVLVVAGVALKNENDTLTAQLSTQNAAAPQNGSTP